ncbi:MAG: hypothetical protein RSA08_02920 [Clostridia bacterium]
MQILIETVIYLLAIMGIILTSMSFFDICIYKNIAASPHVVYNKRSNVPANVSIIIKFENIDDKKRKIITKKIFKGDFENIEEIVDSIKIIN